jgi:hypothetical protein
VTHRESLKAVPELFEALAQNRPSYEKARLYPNGGDGGRAELTGFSRRSYARLYGSEGVEDQVVGDGHDIALKSSRKPSKPLPASPPPLKFARKC